MASDFIAGLDWRSLLPSGGGTPTLGSIGRGFVEEIGQDVLDWVLGGDDAGTPSSNGQAKLGAVPAAGGCEIYVQPMSASTTKCPKGYVAVEVDGAKVCMLKEAAVSCGKWSPRPKPLVSGYEMRALRRAGSAIRKIDTAGRLANRIQGLPKNARKPRH